MKLKDFKILGIEHIGIATNDSNYNQLYNVLKNIMNLDYIATEKILNQKTITTIFDTGSGKIELLQGIGIDSTVDKFIKNKGLGIHHVAFRVKNIKGLMRYLEKNNIELSNKEPQIGAEGYSIIFIHPKSTPGLLIEFCEKCIELSN